jgi:Na+-driven multidrug efflux pump
LRASSESFEQEVKPAGDARKILKLSIPVSLESVFQMGFNVIDQVIVGLLGADAVAAVGLSNTIASIALLLYASAGVGAGVKLLSFILVKIKEELEDHNTIGAVCALVSAGRF